MIIKTDYGDFHTHTCNNAGNIVWYALPYIDTPSYSYWMVPGTWQE